MRKRGTRGLPSRRPSSYRVVSSRVSVGTVFDVDSHTCKRPTVSLRKLFLSQYFTILILCFPNLVSSFLLRSLTHMFPALFDCGSDSAHFSGLRALLDHDGAHYVDGTLDDLTAREPLCITSGTPCRLKKHHRILRESVRSMCIHCTR